MTPSLSEPQIPMITQIHYDESPVHRLLRPLTLRVMQFVSWSSFHHGYPLSRQFSLCYHPGDPKMGIPCPGNFLYATVPVIPKWVSATQTVFLLFVRISEKTDSRKGLFLLFHRKISIYIAVWIAWHFHKTRYKAVMYGSLYQQAQN